MGAGVPSLARAVQHPPNAIILRCGERVRVVKCSAGIERHNGAEGPIEGFTGRNGVLVRVAAGDLCLTAPRLIEKLSYPVAETNPTA